MSLRYYQQESHDAAISWIKRNTAPSLIEAATGAGKSHVIAAIADTFHDISGKHVLCTAPSSELVEQNSAKFIATGNKASLFSASLGVKSLRHPVVFGTPITIRNSIAKFGSKFGIVLIDECDGITPTIRTIIEEIRKENNKLRVMGLTATPYRLGSGLIYAMDEHGRMSSPDECRDPYFVSKVYTIRARELIEQGYLTAPEIGAIHSDHYDTKHLKLNSMGKFFAADVDKAFVGHDRKTSRIVADVVAQSQYRRGVMIFAATVQHAVEIMASLPPELSRMIGGKINTGTEERKRLVKDFKEKKFKYMVSVGTMTVGVDFTHVDVIVLMRSMESIRLMQQIAGRGSRVEYAEGYPLDTAEQRLLAIASGHKPNFLILDYGENFERHCGDSGDLYNPSIKATKAANGKGGLIVKCELCKVENEVTARPNDDGFGIDEYGYFVDLNGERVLTDDNQHFPGHFARRCYALHRQPDGKFTRCNYFWSYKECPECKEKNDIAARYCGACKFELIDPNKKLVDDFRAKKKDPYVMQCDKVLSWSHHKTLSAAGNEVLKVDLITEYRSFSVWFQVRSSKTYFIKQYDALINATQGLELMPTSVTYKKNIKTSFFEVYAWNQEADKLC